MSRETPPLRFVGYWSGLSRHSMMSYCHLWIHGCESFVCVWSRHKNDLRVRAVPVVSLIF